ncbi:Highly reducing polyketide synthase gloL [Cladobotryum mycophilum]|uniref:Highly reducing polyketide synthase gloL n=1 Tax=Cladobotryum mycophilum TaxID=491253 RepID=A0ABR0S5U3_9HYPO
MASKGAPLPPVAIIGMALRLPGGVSTPEEFWNLMVERRDGRCRVPADRYNIDAFHDSKLEGQAVPTAYGYFLNDINLKAFDVSSFSLSRLDLLSLDPQLRLLYEVTWECIESAGQTQLRGTNTGMFVGTFGEDWHDLLRRDSQIPGVYHTTSASDFILSNRVSSMYDLRGPSMTIRTACSASMSALHLACQALHNGDCTAAIVAGTNLILSPNMTMEMGEHGVLSPTGSCKTFDANADGYARGEAVNAVLIKPLEDAVRDGDPIRAVIRSTAVNSDGNTTSQGVKPNVGHAEGASGITSIIKAVLALEHEVIPPNINFTTPNPKLPFEECKLTVPVEPKPWPKDRHARISVNCFGIGGTNAHTILDSAASFGVGRQDKKIIPGSNSSTLTNGHAPGKLNRVHTDGDSNGLVNDYVNGDVDGKVNGGVSAAAKCWPRLLALSANNEKSLHMRVDDIKKYIEPRWDSLDGVAYTLAFRRIHLRHRTFCIANSNDETLDFGSFQKTHANSPDVVFVFTGQGGQWAGMGRELIQTSKSFRSDIQRLDQVLQSLDEAPEWTIEGILCSEDASEQLERAEFAQPLCTAVQIALVNLLATCGVKPSAVVGHSSGEIAAAYAAGALTMCEAIICAYFRGFVMKDHSRNGAMAAVGLPLAAVSSYLVDGVCVACENSPTSVTLSGDANVLDQTLEAIQNNEMDVFTRKLRVNTAYHSHHMQAVGDQYEETLKPHLSQKETAVPFYSTVDGRPLSGEAQLGPKY